MINQIRTLLLNAKQDALSPAPWDRYIPVEFQPLELPAYLDNTRRALVGVDGWWDRTYRVESLLTAVYSPRYAGKFAWLDDRVTEPRVVPFLYAEDDFSVTRVPETGTDKFITHIVKVYDNPLPIKRTWRVLGSGSSLFTVVYGNDNTNRKTVQAYESVENNGWILPLDVDVDLVFSGFGSTMDIWQVSAYKKPKNVFSVYPPLVKAMPSAWTAQLFNATEPSDSPVTEYKLWYQTSVNPEDQVVAVVLAYTLKVSKLLL